METTPRAPDVTVVIATRDRAPELCRTLRKLTSLPEKPPVIVVDNASRDGTAGLVRRLYPDVDVIRLRRACARLDACPSAGAVAGGPGARGVDDPPPGRPAAPQTPAATSADRRSGAKVFTVGDQR